ncbi:MAG: tail fiber domain-containing protein [Bdellovibrio sp.]
MLSFFFSLQVKASPKSLTYQGRILKADGTPLDYGNVSFIFQITNPSGSCVIYQEQVNGYSFVNSGGVFDVPIGEGTVQYPLVATSILDVFNNSASFTCGSCSLVNGNYTCSNGSSTYAASVGDTRKLRVSFYDGSGWKTITPDNTIRSVPFAGYALAAEKIGTHVASDFLLKAGLPTCTAGTFISYDGTSLTCTAVSGSNGGTVTNVTSANSYLTVTNNTSTPTLTVNIGSVANTIAAGNDPRIVNALQSGSTASGDLSGTYPGPSVIALQGVGVSATTPTLGQVLKFNGTNWIPAADNNAGGTVTSVSGTAPITVATGTTIPVISISQSTTSTNGYLSSTDWNTFNNKQAALGFTPLNPANNLSDVANVATSRTNLGLGTAAIKNVPAAGNAASTEVVLGSDTRLSDSRTPAGNAGGDLTGTYPNPTLTTTGVVGGTYSKVTVDTKGRVTAGAGLVAADIPNLDWSKITTGKPTTLSGYGITDSLVVNGGNTGSISSGLDNAKPAVPTTGDLFVAIDVKRIYRYNGTTWDQLADASSTGGITVLTGDVSATGPGSAASTVNNVGGKTAAAIATSVNDTVAATNSNTNSTIIKRDASGNFAANNATLSSVVVNTSVVLNDGQATPNKVTLQAPAAVTTNYVLKLPVVQGSANQLMINDGAGNLSWTTLSSLGGVTSVTAAGTAGNPIAIAGTATAPTVDLAKATSSTNGYLSSADWTTFNNKQNASLGDTQIWVGQTGTPTAVTPSGDVSMTNAGGFTVTGIRGKSVSATAPSAAGQVLRYDGASVYVPAFLGLADIKSTITPFGGAFTSSGCTASQTLYWQSSTDTFQCQSVAINDSQLSYTTSRTANTFLAAPNGSAGAATFRTIVNADLPAGTLSGSGTAGYIPYYSAGSTLANSPIFNSGGNVGIGTTSPATSLHVRTTNDGTYGGSLIENTNSAQYAAITAKNDAGNPIQLGIYGSTNATPNKAFLYAGASTSSLGFFINSAEKMTLLQNGYVGIGTTSPQQLLHLGGAGTSAFSLFTNITTGNTSADGSYIGINPAGNMYVWNQENLPILFGTNNGERMRIDAAGNVGIGTTIPDGKLTIDASGVNYVSMKNLTGGLVLSSGGTANYNDTYITINPHSPTSAYGSIAAFNNSSGVKNLALNESGGNVGIGTTSPSTELHLANNTGLTLSNGNPASTGFAKIMPLNSGAATNTGLGFYTTYSTAGERMRIDGLGNVGIGTTSPNAKLDVDGGTSTAIRGSSTGSYAVIGTSTNTHGVYGSTGVWGGVGVYGYNAATGATGYLAYTNIGGNFTSPSGAGGNGSNSIGDTGLYAGNYAGYYTYLANGSWGANSNGNATFHDFYDQASGVWLSSYSDRRLKKSIKNLPNTFGLEAILKLRPVTYHWKDKEQDATEGEKVGFIAQEVQKVIPDLVLDGKKDKTIETENGTEKIEKPKSFFAQYLTAPIVKAIQEFYSKWMTDSTNLHAQLNQLEAINATREKEIAELKAELLKQKADFDTRLHQLENTQRAPASENGITH